MTGLSANPGRNVTTPRRPTIREVATAAGVSAATVSRVLGGSTSVSAERAQRVRDAAGRLGYAPHVAARSLASGRTHVVGVLVPNLANPYFYALIKQVLHEAHRDSYGLIVADSDESLADERAMGLNLLRHADGLILGAPRCGTRTLEELSAEGKPVLVLNRRIDRVPLTTIVADNVTAMRALTRHVIGLGHRRIAYLQGPPRSWQGRERWRAVRALRGPEVEITPVAGGGTLDDGHRAVPRLLATGCTAVLAHNDLTAVGVIAGLTERGLSVPGDISVTGYDDIPFARFMSPPLTTVRGPNEEAGTAAWRAMAALIGGAAPGTRTRLSAEPVIRESAAPPADGRADAPGVAERR
jgi:DNA-binding LacI/PurR family transcriptional regulator